MTRLTDEESGEFYTRFCPFARLIYRTALIVTGRPRSAERLQFDIYVKAFIEYLQFGHIANFDDWLAKIVADAFSAYKLQRREKDFSIHTFSETEQLLLEKLADCK